MSNKGYYGVSFPFRIGLRGGIAMSGTSAVSSEHITESIQQIIATRVGERVFEYNFGNNISTGLFDTEDESLVSLIKFEICDTLAKLEPRIEVNESNINLYTDTQLDGSNVVMAEISYTIKDYSNANYTSLINLGGE